MSEPTPAFDVVTPSFSGTKLTLLGVGVFVLTLLLNLSVGGLYSVYEVSEAREGEVVNVIWETGEWILPLRHKDIVPSKPPLFHWISLLVPPGAISPELALRVPSMIAGALLAAITFCFAVRTFGLAVGWITVVLLSSSHGFVSLTGDGRVDMLFNLFLCWAIFTVIEDWFVLGSNLPRWRAPLMIGLSVLAKGPLTYVILAIAVIPAMLDRQSIRRFFSYMLSARWILGLVLPLVWYVAATVKGGEDFIWRQLLFENMDRFVGAEGITAKPFYFYLKEIWLFMAPWSLLLLMLLCLLIRQGRGAEWIGAYRGPVIRPLLCWTIVPLIFFSLAVGKRSSYLLTILPPLSILLALPVSSWVGGGTSFEGGKRVFRWIASFLIFITVAPFIVYGSIVQFGGLFSLNISKNIVVAVDRHTVWPFIVVGLVLSLLSLAALYRGLIQNNRWSFVVGVYFFVLLGTLVFPNAWQIYKGDQRTYKYFAHQLKAWGPWTTSEVIFIKRRFDESFDGLFFYLNRAVPLFVPEKVGEDVVPPSKAGFYLARQEWIDQQRDRWVDRVRPILKGGRAIDSSAEQVVLFELVDEDDSGQ